MSTELSTKEIGQRIYFIRGHRVMLDSDLAQLYGVETGALKRAVRRNVDRFPSDFMFQLNAKEQDNLRQQFHSQGKVDDTHHGGTRYPPFVFTQEGVAMLSGVLKSKQAIQVNVAIMRTFVQLRELLESNKDLAKSLQQLEKKYDHQFKMVFDAIRQLMATGSPLTQKKIKTLSEK